MRTRTGPKEEGVYRVTMGFNWIQLKCWGYLIMGELQIDQNLVEPHRLSRSGFFEKKKNRNEAIGKFASC
jgi:hypothetical protein